MSSRRFQDVFKMSSRRLTKTSSIHFQDVFKKSCKNVFKTFLRCSAKKVIYRRICVGDTSEKFMVNVQNLHEWSKFLKFQFFILLHLLVAAYRGLFRTWWNIYNGAFFAKILNSFQLLTIFAKKFHRRYWTELKTIFWLRVWNIDLTLGPSLQIEPRKY